MVTQYLYKYLIIITITSSKIIRQMKIKYLHLSRNEVILPTAHYYAIVIVSKRYKGIRINMNSIKILTSVIILTTAIASLRSHRIGFDKYHNYGEMTDYLEKITSEFSNISSLYSIGKSVLSMHTKNNIFCFVGVYNTVEPVYMKPLLREKLHG